MPPISISASIGIASLPGSQTVQRTVTSVANENGWRTYNVSVEAPPGYEVTVLPPPSSSRVVIGHLQRDLRERLPPIGEWRFGSLTWRDDTGHYSVRSPIAVRGSQFLAPASVNGSGTSGSTSFDIKFGYTGAYTAAAHGLVADAPINDTVVQDPDQTFNPADGFSDVHTFNLSGAAYFRVAIGPADTEADADLDVYVYNPSNQLVASSTLGGTDEVVTTTLPADGAWTVYVHGWQTIGPDSNYTLHSWVVPLASGGSLSLASSPASATAGSVETISVNWSGLATGTQYLGAVPHTGPSGIMGFHPGKRRHPLVNLTLRYKKHCPAITHGAVFLSARLFYSKVLRCWAGLQLSPNCVSPALIIYIAWREGDIQAWAGYPWLWIPRFAQERRSVPPLWYS